FAEEELKEPIDGSLLSFVEGHLRGLCHGGVSNKRPPCRGPLVLLVAVSELEALAAFGLASFDLVIGTLLIVGQLLQDDPWQIEATAASVVEDADDRIGQLYRFHRVVLQVIILQVLAGTFQRLGQFAVDQLTLAGVVELAELFRHGIVVDPPAAVAGKPVTQILKVFDAEEGRLQVDVGDDRVISEFTDGIADGHGLLLPWFASACFSTMILLMYSLIDVLAT